MRFGLPFSLFLAACSSSSGSPASRSSAAGGSDGAGAESSSGGSGPQGSGAGAFNVGAAAGSPGKAGAASSSGGAVGLLPAKPATWNSAKSTMISDDELQADYTAWKVAHVQPCPNGSSVVAADNGVVSEGIGYGMLLSAGMADQPLFDGLWKYYQDHLNENGLMNRSTDQCQAPGDNKQGAATDADLDVTMALVQAAARWPSAGYLAKAQALASKIAELETDMCSGRRVLRPSDTFGGCSDDTDQRLNPSYFSPGYYKVFGHYFVDQAPVWAALVDGSYQLYAIYQARMANLVPDWSGPDGSDNGSGYSTDACRTPFRVAVDYGWTGDTRAATFMQNVSSWVDANGGLPKAAQQQNSAFIGAFALSGGYEQGKFDGYMTSWLSATVDDQAYYSGTLRVLYLLVAAGKFSSTL
jgi:endo-1,4-beta-D-glucanase Y